MCLNKNRAKTGRKRNMLRLLIILIDIDKLEYIEINKLVKERELKDDGVRYSFEQVKKMFKYE